MKTRKKILEAIDAKTPTKTPIWMMRQAGRYLPEYQKVRKSAGSFLDLCYSPELAAEVTLQPIRRFGFDAAILFSDILVIPDALGRKVRFEEKKGPVLEPIDAKGIKTLSGIEIEQAIDHLKPVLETVKLVRDELPDEVALLGFCGAPWTVATYMIAGHGTPDQAPARLFAYKQEKAFSKLIDQLVQASIAYLVAQFRAGADAVQIFDSWSGVLDAEQFEKWCLEPVRQIVDGVRAQIERARIIGFPKGAADQYRHYRQKTGVNGLGLDWTIDLDLAKQLQKQGVVQGNLDPLRLVAGGKALDEGVDRIMEALSDSPFIFNLGHGITPQTPITHVEQMIKRVRG